MTQTLNKFVKLKYIFFILLFSSMYKIYIGVPIHITIFIEYSLNL